MKITQLSPRVYENETIYSIAARVVLNDISSSVSAGIENVAGSRSIQLDALLPSYLINLSSHIRIDVNTLIQRFSLFPYFSLFATEKGRNSALAALKYGKSSAAFKSLGLLANRISESKHHKLCPICAEEQAFAFGETYWLKHHQLPLVTMCVTHQCLLQELPRKRKQLVFPQIVVPAKYTNNKLAFKIADISKSVLEMPPFDLTKLRLCYLIRLIERKLASTKSINISELRHRMSLYYDQQGFEQDVQTLLSDRTEHGYPANIFYAKNASHHPVKHILLIAFLFDHIGDFVVSYTYASKSRLNKLERNLPTSQTSIDEQRRQRVVEALSDHLSLRQVMSHAKVSASTVRNIAIQEGFKINERIKKISTEQKMLILSKLKSDLTTGEIAKQVDCAKHDVEQILTGNPELKLLRKQLRRATSVS